VNVCVILIYQFPSFTPRKYDFASTLGREWEDHGRT